MSGTAAVFIDGGYLDKIIHFDFQNQRIDYSKLVHEVVQPSELFRAYYYHCLPYQSNPPTPAERSFYASKHKFTTALSFFTQI